MKYTDIPHLRLQNQHITQPIFKTAEEVVAYFGAIQSQEYAGAVWSIAQRTTGITIDDIDTAFNEGLILRTHVLRPTWHFVSPENIRWMLQLTGPRIQKVMNSYYKKLGLDEKELRKTESIITSVLEGGKFLTRTELAIALEKGGIDTKAAMRLGFIVGNAELESLICSGPKKGKQHTYALLEERAPKTPKISNEEAHIKLLRLYLESHGPATLKDFTWWADLTLAETRKAAEYLKQEFEKVELEGNEYWYKPYQKIDVKPSPTAYLLSTYDELISYDNRDAMAGHFDMQKYNNLFQNMIIIDGQIVGNWRREIKKKAITILPHFYKPLTKKEIEAIQKDVQRFEEFWKTKTIFQAS